LCLVSFRKKEDYYVDIKKYITNIPSYHIWLHVNPILELQVSILCNELFRHTINKVWL